MPHLVSYLFIYGLNGDRFGSNNFRSSFTCIIATSQTRFNFRPNRLVRHRHDRVTARATHTTSCQPIIDVVASPTLRATDFDRHKNKPNFYYASNVSIHKRSQLWKESKGTISSCSIRLRYVVAAASQRPSSSGVDRVTDPHFSVIALSRQCKSNPDLRKHLR